MALTDIDRTKIQIPESKVISRLVYNTASPEVYVEWLLLFDEYNKAHGTTKSMNCRACYGKVYIWYQKELKRLDNEQIRTTSWDDRPVEE